ncbi:response regulator [Tessaracoccus caeni]|uniref:response regulator n=1 Tax=Tessaracoccus caeni TaxID=3031239 RepID=UPI0023DBD509|nr:response regulator [Tessaracoccus caeni]MDF1486935.1 response regulator [Tessaracoccus caeni]
MDMQDQSAFESARVRLKVGVCDDDALALGVLKSTLELAPSMDLVITTTESSVALAFEGEIDVWLVDIKMPGQCGVKVAQQLTSRENAPKVILITSGAEVPAQELAEAGVSGFLFKDAKLSNYLAAIEAAAAGFHVMSPEVSPHYLPDATVAPGSQGRILGGLRRVVSTASRGDQKR